MSETKVVMINGEKQEVDEKVFAEMAKRKTRWIACIFYPDNPYHVMALNYLKELGLTMCYIHHDAVKGTGSDEHDCKNHIHIMIYFDTPRTASGFASSFGTCPTLFETPQEYEVDEKGKKIKKKRTPVRVLMDNEIINYDSELVGEYPILSHAEAVSHPESYYRYLVHKDFKSRIAHKKEYSWDDINYFGDADTVKKLKKTAFSNKGDILLEVKQYFMEYGSCKSVMGALLNEGRFDLISYIESHSYKTHKHIDKSKRIS